MAKTFDEVVYSLCKKYTNQSQLGFKSVKQLANGFEIEYVNGTKATYTVQDMHRHTNMTILSKFSLSADGKLLYDGKPIEGAGGAGEPYDDAEVRGLIDTNKTNIATNTSDISDLNTKIGTTAMGTTATDVTGAVAEVNGNLLDNVSFSADYKNIVLNRKNGTNPYTIPISAIINHAKLIELADVDVTDIGNGKTLVYDAASQKHKYVSSSGTDELVKMDITSDAHYLTDLIDKQTVVNDNGILKVKKLDGQEVTIAEINYLKGLTMNVMELVNAFANGGVKVLNTPVATYADLTTLDRSTFLEGISYIVYVLADETHAGAKTTYLCDKTNTTFFGNADSQRNFTTDPINLANEVTGKLGTSNIDVDSLWTLLTVDDTYKTLTTTDNVFGTHGAKNMYDELITSIGAKANATDLTTHTDDTDIHITTTERTKWNEVVNKANKTEVLSTDNILVSTGNETHDNVYSAQLTKTELDKKANDDEVVKKTDISTTIDSTSTNDKVASAKAVNDKFDTLSNRIQPNSVIFQKDNTSYSTLSELIQNHEFFKSSTAEEFIFGAEGFDDLPVTNWGFSIRLYTGGGNKHIIAYKMLSSDLFYTRSMNYDGTWISEWKKLCITSVADVPVTNIAPSDTTIFPNFKDNPNCNYCVRNGICYVVIWGSRITSTGTITTDVVLPKCANSCGGTFLTGNGDATPHAYVYVSSNSKLCFDVKDANIELYGNFSYPVAES